MPVTTRTRTGKLPVQAVQISQSFSDIEEVEETQELAEELELEETKHIDGYTNLDDSTLIKQPPASARADPERFVFETFATFKSKSHLRDGLNLVRHVGGGKYEIVNLQYASPDVMGSEEVGNYLRDDPKRLELFEQAREGFGNSKSNIEQAANSAKQEIFRFLKLPFELRLQIYDCTMKAKGKLRYKKDDLVNKNSWLALNLRGVNKQINQETQHIFLKNNFRIIESTRNHPMYDVYMAIGPILREVTFEWWGYANKDTNAFLMISNFKQLKIFNLIITKYCVHRTNPLHSQRRQYTYQAVPNIEQFSRSNGFDALMTIRGLEKVNVTSSERVDIAVGRSEVSLREIDHFEAFLNQHLTLPRRVVTAPIDIQKKNPTKVESSKKKRKFYGTVDDGDEASDLNYRPYKSRRRTR